MEFFSVTYIKYDVRYINYDVCHDGSLSKCTFYTHSLTPTRHDICHINKELIT